MFKTTVCVMILPLTAGAKYLLPLTAYRVKHADRFTAALPRTTALLPHYRAMGIALSAFEMPDLAWAPSQFVPPPPFM